MIRVRHYTNNQGIDGIEQSGVILPKDKGRVFAENARKKPKAQVEAEDYYQIGRGRGKNYVETDVPKSRVEEVLNERTGRPELRIKGIVPLQNPTFVRRN